MLKPLKWFASLARKPHRVLAFFVSLWMVLVLGTWHPAVAQSSISQGTIAEILDGTQVYIQNAQARVNDVATRGQQVRTGTARAQLNFNTGAVARLATNSVLTIGQCAQLQQGVLLVNGAVNGCTSSVTAGVRGTTYLLKVNEDGEEEITVLEGEVVVTKAESPETTTITPPGEGIAPGEGTSEGTVVLTPGQRISTRRGEPLGSARSLTVEEFLEILAGQLFDGFLEQLPGMSRIQDVFNRLYPNVPFPGGSAPSIPRPSNPFF